VGRWASSDAVGAWALARRSSSSVLRQALTRVTDPTPAGPPARGLQAAVAGSVGTRPDRRRIRRLARKRPGPCGGPGDRARGWRPVSAFRAVPEPLRVRDAWDPQPEIDEGVAQARRRLAELGDLEPYAASADDAAEALARYGAAVDLLVVGSHEYRPIDHLLPGSTAQRLADDTPCPLLVLPSGRSAAG
jgi:nucleotide-binding universal stress UspA family protein